MQVTSFVVIIMGPLGLLYDTAACMLSVENLPRH